MATITSPRSESPAITIPGITSPRIPHSPSIGGTPTSSVRPSIDLPVRNNSSSPSLPQNATQAPATAQRRNRAALRDYYNLKSKAPAGQGPLNISRTASIASNASDSTVTSSTYPTNDSTGSALTAQLDDPSFDAEAYVSDLLKTAGLRDILRTESVLVSEIRNLDGERKALVYDNYSKLIKAVGTIAEMQKGMHKREQQDRFGSAAAAALGRNQKQGPGLEGVENLGEKLDALVTVVKELVPGMQEAVARNGSPPSREMARQRETVKWALEAPNRLQDLVAKQEHDEARREYDAVIEILGKWQGVRGVDELRVKCTEIVNPRPDSEDGSEEDDKSEDSG